MNKQDPRKPNDAIEKQNNNHNHPGPQKVVNIHKKVAIEPTIVKINTNIGISGLGEVCTLGPAYLPAYAEGVRTGIKQIGKYLINKDPTDLQEINLEKDKNLKGHNYVKSPIDIACWDITSKVMQFIRENEKQSMIWRRFWDDFGDPAGPQKGKNGLKFEVFLF